MRILLWLLRAALFFTLFAFALNNQHEAGIKWFFNQEWRAPMVFIVLAAFGAGCAFGVFAMVPSWWQHRRVAQRHRAAKVPAEATSEPRADLPAELDPHLPRHEL